MKHTWKRLLATVFSLTMLLSVLALPASANKANEAAQSVVRILAINEDNSVGLGTAFYVGQNEKGKDIFVTNRHVVTDDKFEHAYRIYILKDNSTSFLLETYAYFDADFNLIAVNPPEGLPRAGTYLADANIDTGRTISCDILYTTYSSDEPDIAIIEASENLPGLKPLPLMATKEVQAGSNAYVIGFPGQSDLASTYVRGDLKLQINENVFLYYMESKETLKATPDEATITTGVVSRVTEREVSAHKRISVIQTDAKMNQGNSGGPTLLENGAVIGINTFGLKDETKGHEVSDDYATSIDYVITQLNTLGVKYEAYSQGVSSFVWIIIVLAIVAVVAAIVTAVLLLRPRRKTADEGCIMGKGGLMDGVRCNIDDQVITIGRNPENDICYPANTAGISRLHCKLFVQDGALMIVDLDSTSGTFLNGNRRLTPNEAVSLKLGDIFYLGEPANSFVVM